MIPITSKSNTSAPDGDYPFGNLKDKVGVNPGTPVDKELLADQAQFFEKIMDAAGLIANELPDNEYSGFQLFEALKGEEFKNAVDYTNASELATWGTYSLKFYKGLNGRVNIEGTVVLQDVTGGGPGFTPTFFTLPEGYRPTINNYSIQLSLSGNYENYRLKINTTGVVELIDTSVPPALDPKNINNQIYSIVTSFRAA